MQQRLGGKMAVRRVAAGTAAVGRVGCNWEGVGARAAARRGSCGRRSAAAELPSTTRRALWTTAAPDRLAAVSRVRAAQSALMEATMLGEREGANGTVPMVGKVASIDAAAMRRVAPPVDVAGDSTPELRCAFGTRLRLGPWGSQSPEKARTKANDELCKDGANLHVNYVDSEQDAGADEPLVLMHGFGSGLGLFFSNYVGVGARERRVIGVDWLGMGGSGRPPFPRRPACSRAQDEAATVAASIAFFVDSLEAWRAAAGIPRMRLFGHSLGGYLAANYALTYPERVTRLVLAGPVGLPDAGEPADAPADQDLPLNLRLITGAWAHNVTPQAIVRALGPRGERMVQVRAPLSAAAGRCATHAHVLTRGGNASRSVRLQAGSGDRWQTGPKNRHWWLTTSTM